MRTFPKRRWSLIIALAAVPSTLLACAAMADVLSLKEAKEEALKTNFDIRISREKVIQSDMLSKESYTRLLPEVSLNGKATYLEEETAVKIDKGYYGTYAFGSVPSRNVKIVTGENNESVSGSIRLQQPVFAGGRIYNSYLEAQSKMHEAEWDEKQVAQDILFNVEAAYFNVLKAQEMDVLAVRHEETLNAHLADMQKLYEKGRVAYIDVLKVKVQIARARGDVVRARNLISSGRRQLNLILGRPVDQPLELVPIETLHDVAMPPDKAEKLAKSNNQALKKIRTQRITSLLQRRVAEADYYPNVVFATEYTAQSGQPSYPDEQWAVTLTMSWPVWQWGGTDYKVGAARAYERQIEHAISSLENQISAAVKDVYAQLQEIGQRLEIDKEALVQAQENFRITKIGFDHGRKTSTDIIDAEEQLARAESQYAQDRYDSHVVGAQLRHIIGRMELASLQDLEVARRGSIAEEILLEPVNVATAMEVTATE